MAARFDDEAAQVDQAVFNAGRITKLYGTVANKGDHTPFTPWRLSRLVSGADREAVVTADQLRAMHPKGNGADPKTGSGDFDLSAFLLRLGIPYDQDMHDGAERYKLSNCPFIPEHCKGEAAIFRQTDGRLGFRCQHNSCADKRWKDVRALVDGPRGGTPHGTYQSGCGKLPAGTAEDLDATVRRLATLSPMEYDRMRTAEAEELGVRVATLDAEVEKLRREATDPSGASSIQGQAVVFDDPEPWPDEVDGAAAFNEASETLSRRLAVPDSAADAMALWTVHTHCHMAFLHSPRLNITSPEKAAERR